MLNLPIGGNAALRSASVHRKSRPSRSPKNKEEKMNATSGAAEVRNRRMMLSTLWIFATLNYVYADVFTVFFLPGAQASTAAMPTGAALGFSVLMETAI